jgi:large repetitive protein
MNSLFPKYFMMKRILTLLCIIMLGAIGITKAQSVAVNAPKTVCMSTNNSTADQLKFMSVDATVQGAYSSTNLGTWTITTPSGTDADYEVLYTDNTSATTKANKLTSTRQLTIQFLKPGTYTFKVNMPYVKTKGGATLNMTSATYTVVAVDCTISTCSGGNATMPGFTENFGTMTDPTKDRAYPVSGVVQYTYQANAIPTQTLNDNYYVIAATTRGRPDWVGVKDHTGNANGAMLVANSAIDPLKFYEKKVSGLCRGAVYNFSAWLLDLDGPGTLMNTCVGNFIYAGVTFQVVDANNPSNVLASFNTYDIGPMLGPNSDGSSVATWQRFGGSLTIPSGVTDVLVRIINNHPGGCGNDIAVDDIDFSYCSPIITASIAGTADAKEVLCEGTPTTINASYIPTTYFTQPTYLWEWSSDNGLTWSKVPFGTANAPTLQIDSGELKGTRTTPADYLFRVRIFELGSDSISCAAPSSPVLVHILPMPTLSLSRSEICAGDLVELHASGGFDGFYWKDDPTNTNPTRFITPVSSGPLDITVYGYINYGAEGKQCIDSNTAEIAVSQAPLIDVTSDDPTSICLGGTVTLNINSQIAAMPGVSIRWLKGPSLPGGTDTTWIPEFDGMTSVQIQPADVNDTVYSVRVQNYPCDVSSAPFVIHITPVPNAQPGPPQMACASANPEGLFTMAATLDPKTTGSWTVVSVSGPGVVPDALGNVDNSDYVTIPSPNNPNAKVLLTTYGVSAVLAWTVKSTVNGTCTSTNTTTVTLLNDPQSANAGLDTTQCGTQNVFHMAANPPDPSLATTVAEETGTWSLFQGNVSQVHISDIHDPNATVTVDAPQDVRLVWTITNNAGCPALPDTVTLHYLGLPHITLKPIAAVCNTAGSFVLDTLSTSGAPTLFSLTAGTPAMPGFTPITEDSLNWPITIPIPTGIAAGTYQFHLTFHNNNGGCSNDTLITVPVDLPPTDPTGVTVGSPNICATGTTTLTVVGGDLGQHADGTPGAQWVWYSGSCGGTPVGTGPTITVSVSATTTYYVRAEGTGPCAMSNCASGTVTVFTQPTASSAGPDQDHCMNPAFTMAANAASVGAGTWTIVPGTGSATITDPTNPATAVNVNNGDSVHLAWTIINGVCSTSDTVVLHNYLQPTANAGADQAQCMTSSFTVTGNTPPAGATGQWTLTAGFGSGTAVIATPNSPTTNVTVNNGDSALLIWTVTNGTCVATDDVKLVNSQAPTTANAGPDQEACNVPSFTLAANTPTIGTGLWSVVAGTATFMDATNPATTVTVTAGTSATLQWTITNGTCTSTDQVIITNDAAPAPANAGADQAQCNTSSFTVTGNTPSVGTGVWSVVSGAGVVITTPTAVSTVVTVPAGIVAVLRWSITNGLCSTTDDVQLTNSLPPTPANAGADQNGCAVPSFTLAANTPVLGTGVWSVVSGPATITNPADPASTVTVTPGSTAVLQWTITNGGCTSTDQVSLTNDLAPSPAAAGVDQVQCQNTSFTVTGNTPTVGTGTWTVTSGAGVTIATPGSATTSVTVPDGVVAVLTWTITNGTCITSDDVQLTNFAKPTQANAGPDQANCENIDFTLAANAPAAGETGTWTLLTGAGYGSALTNLDDYTSPTTMAHVAIGDSAFLVWTISNGMCNTTDTVKLVNNAKPAPAYAGPDQDLCAAPSFTITGSTPTDGAGKWSVLSGPGFGAGTATVTNVNSISTAVNVPVGDSAYLVWTITNGICVTTDTLRLRNYQAPTPAAAGPDQAQCMTNLFTLAGNAASVGVGTWSLVPGVGTGTATIANVNSPTTTVTVPNGDTARLVWSITNGACNTTDTVQLINYQMPVDANAGPDQSGCNTPNFTLAGNTPTPASAVGTWTIVSGTATITNIHSATTTVTGIAVGTTVTLRWTITNGTCTSVPDDVTLSNQSPVTNNTISADQTLCSSEIPATLTGTTPTGGTGTYTYQWQSSTTSATTGFADISGATSPNFSPGTITQNTWFRRVVTSGACANSSSNAVALTLISQPPVVVSVPASITVDCVQGKDYTTLFGTPVFSHAPYNSETLTVTSADVTTPVDACTFTIKRTWTATDRCGMTTTAQQTLTVVDKTAPVFTATAPANVTINCDQPIPAATTLPANDACAGAMTITPIQVTVAMPGTCTNNYQIVRKWVAVDACGNASDTLYQTITVKDMTPPVFTSPVPANITVDCDKVPAKTDLTATDNCTPGVITVTPTDTRTQAAGACANNYKIIRTWTATDACGNATTLTQTITVQDTTRPVFNMTVPASVTVDCDKVVSSAPTITATDNCSANVTVTTTEKTTKGSCGNTYTIVRTWTAKDECGNTNTMTQTIFVQDTTKPVFTVAPPGDTTVNCDAVPAPPNNIVATDNCSVGANVKVSYTQTRNTLTSCSYQLIRTWTAKDECNNAQVFKQTITVTDTTKPVIDPAPTAVTLSCGQSVPVAATLYAKDNCDGTFPKKAIMTEDPYTIDLCNGYTITRRWNITDACGNTAIERVQVITVNPCPKPTLDPNLPVNCSDNTKFAILLMSKVNKPKFTLVSVVPAGAVSTPLTQTSNVFDLKGATQATFIVSDGTTNCVSDPVTYNLQYLPTPVVNLGNDTAICAGSTLTLDAGAANAGYTIKWSTGEVSQTIDVTKAGTYSVTVSNGTCTTTGTIKVTVNTAPVVNLKDTAICTGQSVKLNAYQPGATYSWSTGDTGPSITVSTANTYTVSVTLNGCTTTVPVSVAVSTPPNVTLTPDTSICPKQSVALSVNPDGGSVVWSDNTTDNSILVSKPGDYWVTVTRGGCTVKDTVHVTDKSNLAIDLGPDRDICTGGMVVLDATNPDAISYLWNDGDTNPVKEVTTPGKYLVSVMDKFCSSITKDSVNVLVAGIPSTLLPPDTTICIGQTLTLKVDVGTGNSIRWQDNSTASTYVVSQSGIYTVIVYNECGSVTDDITVTYKPCESDPQFPTGFTPNGDGKNDTFKPHVSGPMYDYDLRVYNRWGQLIFISHDSATGWDGRYQGKLVEVGTYVWMLGYKNTVGGTVNVVKGEVTVVR